MQSLILTRNDIIKDFEFGAISADQAFNKINILAKANGLTYQQFLNL